MQGGRGVVVWVMSLVLCTMLAACVSVGKPFPVEQVPNIQIGRHTPSDIAMAHQHRRRPEDVAVRRL
jgi:hypothetical protein